MTTRREEIEGMVKRIPLFWKVLVLVLAVALIPTGIAVSTSLTGAVTTAERLIETNIRQLADRVAERLGYTLVSIEGDLDVLQKVKREGTDYLAFAMAQRREMYGMVNGQKEWFSVPKYMEVGFYDLSGKPETLVYKDEIVTESSDWLRKTWCVEPGFVEAAIQSPRSAVVTGLIGCDISQRQYRPGGGLIGEHLDGGIRVSSAVLDERGQPIGVVSLVLSELHLSWALQSLQERKDEYAIWSMVVDSQGNVISHGDPQRILTPSGADKASEGWNGEGGWSLQRFASSGDAEMARLLAESGRGRTTSGQLSTGNDLEWMVAVQPIVSEFGRYSEANPFASVWVFYSREAVFAEWLRLAVQFTILLGVTAILALIGSILLARNLASPIRRLSAVSEEIAQGMEPEIPALDRGDEIGELARSFRRMQLDLRVHQEALMRSERLAAVGTFVAGIVHETKNVLAGLGNYLTLLDRRFRDDPIRDDVIGPMRRALDQLDTLTLRMRELALKPRFSEMELTEVLRHSLELVETQAREQNIAIQCDLDETVILAKADGSLLGQVFLNLILNAVQASPPGGTIQIGMERTTDTVRVAIRDSGKGFPEELMDEVFKPFVTTKAGGTGLGLYISRSIVLRHGGDLEVGNHPDGGAVVTVILAQTH